MSHISLFFFGGGGFPGSSDGKESDYSAPLGYEDLLEKGTATHSSVLTWRIPWTDSVIKGQQRY